VRRRAAVGIDDDLAAGEAGVTVRAADDEAAGGVHIELLVVAHPAFGQGLQNMATHQFAKFFPGWPFHRAGLRPQPRWCDRLAVRIPQGDLAFGIGPSMDFLSA